MTLSPCNSRQENIEWLPDTSIHWTQTEMPLNPSSNPTEKHQVDIYIDLSKISAMHEESEEPQKTIEELVPSVISTLVCPMTSREIAASTGLSPATAGNVLKVASSYGLASKALPFNQKRQIWVRAEGDTYAAAQAAWEMRKKRRSTQPLSCETPPSSSINEDFWSRWLRNDPTTRPKLDD